MIFLLLMVGAMLHGEITAEKLSWDKFMVIPPEKESWWQGKQVLNLYPGDRDYRESEEARLFVESTFQEARPFDVDAKVMKYAVESVSIEDGAYLEMGVCTGRTINFIAALNPDKKIYGFDSFEGLPDAWDRLDHYIPKGTFRLLNGDSIPSVLHNVSLFKGLFRDTLPFFREKILKDQPIAFLHIDCDIYSSTKDVFDILGDNIVSGTVIIFDELYNYPGFLKHEYKALQEFLERSDKRVRYIAYNEYGEQVVVQIE